MPISTSEVEAIVRVVMQRLGVFAAQTEEGASRAEPQINLAAEPSPASDPGTLVLAERVVTLDTLQGKLGGKSRLCVDKNAVVTPAVVDELRSLNVKLEKQCLSSSDVAQSAGGKDMRLLIVAGAELQNCLNAFGEFTTSSHNNAADVRRIAAHLNSGGTMSIWVTSTPYAANRSAAGNSTLHAVQLSEMQEFVRATREADPNVIIVDEKQWKTAELKELATAAVGRMA
ncbi:MAG: hypothetical protein AAF394_00595 [Planctomycetota bacterium]